MLVALPVLVISLSPNRAASQAPLRVTNCCVEEYNAGVNLGWVAAALGPERPAVSRNKISFIVARLWNAANHIQGANAACQQRVPVNEAWPNWWFLQEQLFRIGRDLSRHCLGGGDPVECETAWRSAWHEVRGMFAGWGNALGDQVIGQPLRKSTCDTQYFKIGFRLGYAQVAFYEGFKPIGARELIGTGQLIEDLRIIQPTSGYCVYLWHEAFIHPRIRRILNQMPTASNKDGGDRTFHIIIDIRGALGAGWFPQGMPPVRACPIGNVSLGPGRANSTPFPPGVRQALSTPTPARPVPPPAVQTPPPHVRPINLSGKWVPVGGGKVVVVFTGSGTSYQVTGTDGHYKHEGTLVGDGIRFEGRFKDLPGWCCKREGYVWLEVVDENTHRSRSVWWTPGAGSREKPQLTYGWSTWKRVSR
jgi:hypothetical protein